MLLTLVLYRQGFFCYLSINNSSIMDDNLVREELKTTSGPTNSLKAMPEKIIFIRRKLPFHQASHTDPEVQQYFNMAYRAIGSYYKEIGRRAGSGLTKFEERLLMSELTGHDPVMDKTVYNKAVDIFYKNINTKVPGEGLRLNIALEYEGELSESNFPQKLGQYVTYRHALGHLEVGANMEEAMKYDHIKFYVDDQEAMNDIAFNINKLEDEAMVMYYDLKGDSTKVDQMLTVLGESVPGMDAKEKAIKLKQHATSMDGQTSGVNQEKLNKFISFSKDKNLEYKYRIEEMVRVGVLERVNMQFLIKETADIIGRDMKEAVVWFKDPTNSREVNVLDARYNEFKK